MIEHVYLCLIIHPVIHDVFIDNKLGWDFIDLKFVKHDLLLSIQEVSVSACLYYLSDLFICRRLV
jgi:hypothetical protein